MVYTKLIIVIVGIFIIDIVGAASYDYNSITNCNGRSCTSIIYSGEQFAKDKYGNWVTWDKAQSLLNNGFNIVYLENDPTYKINIIDFNATSITMDLNTGFKIFPVTVPIAIWEDNQVFNKDYKSTAIKTSNQELTFSLIKQTYRLTIPFDLKKNILEFGPNSTTIILKTANSENLADSYLDASGSAQKLRNYGASENLIFNSNFYTMLIKFNLSSIPSNAQIINSYLMLQQISGSIGNINFSVYNVTNYWKEGTGNGVTNTNNTNGTTWYQRYYTEDNSGNWTTNGGDYDPQPTDSNVFNVVFGKQFNITTLNIVSAWVNGDTANNGMIVKNNKTSFVNVVVPSKEYTTDPSQRPALYISYNIISPQINCTYYSGSGDYIISCNDNCTLNQSTDLQGNGIIFNGSGQVIINASFYNYSKINVLDGCLVGPFKVGINN